MASFLERYQGGEHAQVWRELVGLGEAVFEEPLRADALAVAEETMRRARRNVELVTSRLRELGYRFLQPEEAFVPPDPGLGVAADAFEAEVGRLPLSLRAWIDHVGTVNWMGSYPRLCFHHEIGGGHPMAAVGTPGGGTARVGLGGMLQEADSLLGRLDPNSEHTRMLQGMRGLIGLLGGGAAVSGGGEAPAMAEEDELPADPLVVDARELSVEFHEEWGDILGEDAPPFAVTVAPDAFHKIGEGGSDGYAIELPAACADAPLQNTDEGAVTFVEYLRLSFEWGGFPGLRDHTRRDEAVLAKLREGLEPL